MDDKVNLAEKVRLIDKPYRPGIVGYLNDYKLEVVKVSGRFVWHRHDDTDDFFSSCAGISRFTSASATSRWPRENCLWCRAASSIAPRRMRKRMSC